MSKMYICIGTLQRASQQKHRVLAVGDVCYLEAWVTHKSIIQPGWGQPWDHLKGMQVFLLNVK